MFKNITSLSNGDIEVILDALDLAASETSDRAFALASLHLVERIAMQHDLQDRFDDARKHREMLLSWAKNL